MYNVTVIGAGGHVGLPFAIINALNGNQVIGIDTNHEIVKKLNFGEYPYVEEEGKESLEKSIKSGNLKFTTNKDIDVNSDIVAVMIGTPVDSENNPRLDDVLSIFDNTISPFIKKRTANKLPSPIIILRSTVSPGTTDLIHARLKRSNRFDNYILAFCPERVIQGKSIKETALLPQLIGAHTELEFLKIARYFDSFNKADKIFLTPKEAEIAKLFTNMYRYITFAIANEFYIIGDKEGVDAHKVIKAANFGYPRMDVPMPGPNVGGPCLFKDGRFLLNKIPFVDLIQSSFIINEGMPEYIFWKMMEVNPDIKSVKIYGMTFKADNDDTRHSLSYKFKKICERNGLEVGWTDPYVGDSPNALEHFDAHVIMTPHSVYKDMWEFGPQFYGFPKDTVLVDVWKIANEQTKKSLNGIVRVE